MIPIKMPAWVDSIRSVVTVIFVISYCWSVMHPRPGVDLSLLGSITKDIVIFYFVIKRRTEEGKSQ